VPAKKLLEAKALAARYDAPILIHMAEFENEPSLIASREPDFRKDAPEESVVEYLDRIGFLGDEVIAAHVSFVDETDMAILKRRGVGVGHNPKANSKGISGLSPAWEMYQMGLDIGLGTDGPMSSNQMDILNVMTFAASVARLRLNDPKLFTPLELVEMATLGGARALNRVEDLGSLEVGKLADLVLLDRHAPNMQPNYDPYATIAFSAYPANVRATVVNGAVIVHEGAVETVDRAVHQAEWDAVVAKVAGFAETLEAR
ncbi:MAG: amidohydrolase family protein, partial [Pseudomonadota bacterium]